MFGQLTHDNYNYCKLIQACKVHFGHVKSGKNTLIQVRTVATPQFVQDWHNLPENNELLSDPATLPLHNDNDSKINSKCE